MNFDIFRIKLDIFSIFVIDTKKIKSRPRSEIKKFDIFLIE
jgi:hypothetical protein